MTMATSRFFLSPRPENEFQKLCALDSPMA